MTESPNDRPPRHGPFPVVLVHGQGSLNMALVERLLKEELPVVVVEADPNLEPDIQPPTALLRGVETCCEVVLAEDDRPAWQKMNDEAWRQRRTGKMKR